MAFERTKKIIDRAGIGITSPIIGSSTIDRIISRSGIFESIQAPQIISKEKQQERIRIAQQKAREAEEIAKREGSFLGQVKNFILGLPKATAQVGIDILHGVARSGGSVGLQITGVDTLKKEFLPEGVSRGIFQFLFGDEPLESISRRIEKFPERAEKFGIDRVLGKKIAPVAIIGFTLADFIPGGGRGKNIMKQLVKATKPAEVARILKSIGISDDIIKASAKSIAKTTDEKIITKIIDDNIAKSLIKKTAPRIKNEVTETGKIVKQQFRIDKLDIRRSDIKQIEMRLEALGLGRRTVRTFPQIQLAAQELGAKDVNALLKDVRANRITDAEVVALRNHISKQTDELIRIDKILKQVNEGKIQLPEHEIRRLNFKIRQANEQINIALKKLVPGGTEAGRAVAAFRIQAEKTLSPEFWFRKAEKVLDGREFTIEMKAAIYNLIREGNRQGLATFISMLRKPTLAEKAITLWKAGLLTSPTTLMANMFGNVTMSVLMTASDVVSTGFDVLASLATGRRTITISPSTIAAKLKGFKSGIVEGTRFLKTGIYEDDLLMKWDLSREVRFNNKIMDGYVQSVFRSLGATDIVFRKAAWSEAMEKQAIVIAKNEGLSGALLRERVRELLQNPTNEMVANAIDAAEYTTFTRKNSLASMISGLKRASPENLRAGVEFIMPFVKTPTNIANTIVDFSPAGFLRALATAANPSTRSQKLLVEQLGRATTGTGIIAFGAMLAQKGLMTGNAPESPSERADFYADGKQPHSILIGDTWYRLDRVSPLGNLLALGADFYELSKEKEGPELAVATFGAAAKGLTEQTFLRGVSGALGALTEPERRAEQFLEQSVASIVPSVVGRIARTIDPKMRVPENTMDAIKTRLPLLTKQVPVRRDVFGYSVEVSGGRLNLLDPFSTKRAKNHPVLKEAKRLGVVIGLPSKTISGIKLTEREYSLYQKIQGTILEQVLLQLIKSKKYQEAGNSQKAEMLEKAKREVRRQINNIVFPALMIIRFGLPEDTHPQILRDLLTELTQIDEFNKMNDEKKSRVLKRLLKVPINEKGQRNRKKNPKNSNLIEENSISP